MFKEVEEKEYFENRHQYICSTDIGAITGVHPYKSAYDVWLEKKQMKTTKLNDAMRYGMEHEEEARRAFEQEMNVFISKKKPVLHDNGMFACAFDGVNEEEDYLLEIKCPTYPKLYNLALTGRAPEYYYGQVQWQLMHSKADYAYFYVWMREGTAKVKIERNERLMKEMYIRGADFYVNHMQTDMPPPIGEKESVLLTDEDLKAKAEEFIKIKGEMKTISDKLKPLQVIEKRLKEEIKEFSDGGNCHGFGVKIVYSDNKRIDKEKVMRDLNINDQEFNLKYITNNPYPTVMVME